jgi:hypothetical protein
VKFRWKADSGIVITSSVWYEAGNNIGPSNTTNVSFLDSNWEVQAGIPDKIFDKKIIYV